jgi:hypothetical protein
MRTKLMCNNFSWQQKESAVENRRRNRPTLVSEDPSQAAIRPDGPFFFSGPLSTSQYQLIEPIRGMYRIEHFLRFNCCSPCRYQPVLRQRDVTFIPQDFFAGHFPKEARTDRLYYVLSLFHEFNGQAEERISPSPAINANFILLHLRMPSSPYFQQSDGGSNSELVWTKEMP